MGEGQWPGQLVQVRSAKALASLEGDYSQSALLALVRGCLKPRWKRTHGFS